MNKFEEDMKEIIDEMNSIKSPYELHNYIVRVFIMDDILDENGELANNLADLHEEIMWLEIEKNRDTNPTIDKLKLQMKDLINDAYEKNTLVFIKAPI